MEFERSEDACLIFLSSLTVYKQMTDKMQNIFSLIAEHSAFITHSFKQTWLNYWNVFPSHTKENIVKWPTIEEKIMEFTIKK